MRKVLAFALVALILVPTSATGLATDEEDIRVLTADFCRAIVAGDLSSLDRIFDSAPTNVYYDINEQMIGFARMRQVWQAATTNYSITRFDFGPDMKISVKGEEAVQTGSWQQTQQARSGESRNIVGRATILWKKTGEGWRVYHYHASITPRGR